MKKYIGFLFVIALLYSSCEQQSSNMSDPILSVNSDSACKQWTFKADAQPGPDQSCIRWSYDDNGTLTITHINAGFNCCPEKLLASFEINDNNIYITEDDSLALCHCNCLYDLEMVLQNIAPDNYILHISEPLVADSSEQFRIELDLKHHAQGEFFIDRTFYPWGSQ